MLGDVQDPKDEVLPAAILQGQARNSTSATPITGHMWPFHQAESDEHFTNPPGLTEAESYWQLVEWNQTAADYPCHLCLHQLFEAQAEQIPWAVAAVCEGEEITYSELNKRANLLAYRLRQLGAGPEVVVGVYMERNLDLMTALLGILKAGAVYTPLDPAYPQERLDFMLRDAQITLLLTQQHLKNRLPANIHQVIYLDSDWDASLPASAQENSESGVSPENLVYVLYTSGSTGRPKGITIQHRGVVNNIVDLNTRFHVGVGDSILALSALSFDMSVYELLGMPAAGAKVIIPVHEKLRDPAHWAALINRYQVTLWNTAPALLEMLLTYVDGRPELYPRSLRLALIAGDWCPLNLPDRLKSMAEHALFVNLGGATEVSIYSTLYPVMQSDSTWKSIPYGKPLANQQAYLLDASFQLLPVGETGELYFGGTGLARGYLQRPELTAEKFIPHPFARTPGERIYRTGDLARFLPDGTLEFLGRVDFQVKIHGMRIELGEIEAVLCTHPGVREAIVIAHTKAEEKRLAAYIVPKAEHIIVPDELRHYLQKRLPDYMVPSAFTLLAALPLLPNGKIDRMALPTPVWGRERQEQTYIAPRTPVETQLAEIWTDVLPVKHPGLYDNFFSLGGDSLLATQMLARLRAAFHLEIPLAALFKAATLLELAQYIEAASQAQDGDLHADTATIQHLEREDTALDDLLARLEHLSDLEVQTLLAANADLGDEDVDV